MLAPGTVLQGRYQIERLLGQGGMSTVYVAHHRRLRRKVAIKALQVLSSDPKEQHAFGVQLEEEASIMANLSHPNLALVLDFFDEAGTPYLVMELIEGRNLQEVAELAPKLLSQRRVLDWASQLLDVLEYLHEADPPVIVRDLKPGNIMLDSQRRVRLIDFGLAKVMRPGQGTGLLVRGMGSQGYAPIEQYGGSAGTDARADLYALGATLYFLLTDMAPPEASDRVANGTPLLDPRTLNDSVTASVWSVLQKLLALDRKDRPASAREVKKMLGLAPVEAALALAPQPVAPPPPAVGTGQCPRCLQPLQVARQQYIELDICPSCRGLWLDRGELEQIVEIATLTARPETPKGAPPAPPKKLWEHLLDLVVERPA